MDKTDDSLIVIREQIVKDLPTNLTIIFRSVSNGESIMHLEGSCLPFGNRNFQFNSKGELVGTDTCLLGYGIVEDTEEEVEKLGDEN